MHFSVFPSNRAVRKIMKNECSDRCSSDNTGTSGKYFIEMVSRSNLETIFKSSYKFSETFKENSSPLILRFQTKYFRLMGVHGVFEFSANSAILFIVAV